MRRHTGKDSGKNLSSCSKKNELPKKERGRGRDRVLPKLKVEVKTFNVKRGAHFGREGRGNGTHIRDERVYS